MRQCPWPGKGACQWLCSGVPLPLQGREALALSDPPAACWEKHLELGTQGLEDTLGSEKDGLGMTSPTATCSPPWLPDHGFSAHTGHSFPEVPASCTPCPAEGAPLEAPLLRSTADLGHGTRLLSACLNPSLALSLLYCCPEQWEREPPVFFLLT